MTTKGDWSESTFIDANVLVQATVSVAPLHDVAVARIADFAAKGSEFWISRQVLREYLATLSRPQTYTPPLPPALLVADITQFQARFRMAEDGPRVTDFLLGLISTIPVGGKQIHDANIVATMQAHGIRRILTHNTVDFARFVPRITVEPLVTT